MSVSTWTHKALQFDLRNADNSLGWSIPLLSAMVFDELQIDRRVPWRGSVHTVLINSKEARDMWGIIAKITLLPSRRDEMIQILKESAVNMPGCLRYVLAKDAADENTIWVTEVWDSMASHDASLSLPAVKNAIPRGKAIVSNFERIAVTSPVWGAGLPARAH
jgi:quinol monooxygenase YgiN